MYCRRKKESNILVNIPEKKVLKQKKKRRAINKKGGFPNARGRGVFFFGPPEGSSVSRVGWLIQIN